MSGREKPASPAAQAEAVRLQRLREDAQRPMSVNLAEGIALSHKLLQFEGATRKRAAGRTRDLADLEDLESAS